MDDNFPFFCGMMDGLAFLPPNSTCPTVWTTWGHRSSRSWRTPDLLQPDICVSETFCQQPQNGQHVQQGQIQNSEFASASTVTTCSMNTHEATLTGNTCIIVQQHLRRMEQQVGKPGAASPSICLENYPLVPEGKCHSASPDPARQCMANTQKVNQMWTFWMAQKICKNFLEELDTTFGWGMDSFRRMNKTSTNPSVMSPMTDNFMLNME